MARTPLTLVITLALGLAAAASQPVKRTQNDYLVDIGSYSPTLFCGEWRNAAWAIAGAICHHHETTCTILGNGQAMAAAFYVPFIDNPNGQCNTSKGPAKGPKTDTTYEAARNMGNGVKVIKQTAGAPSTPPPAVAAPAPPVKNTPMLPALPTSEGAYLIDIGDYRTQVFCDYFRNKSVQAAEQHGQHHGDVCKVTSDHEAVVSSFMSTGEGADLGHVTSNTPLVVEMLGHGVRLLKAEGHKLLVRSRPSRL